MAPKITIYPNGKLLGIPANWRRQFLVEAGETILAEGRYAEIMEKITGLTVNDLLVPQTETAKKTELKAKPDPSVQHVEGKEVVLLEEGSALQYKLAKDAGENDDTHDHMDASDKDAPPTGLVRHNFA